MEKQDALDTSKVSTGMARDVACLRTFLPPCLRPVRIVLARAPGVCGRATRKQHRGDAARREIIRDGLR